MFEHTSELSLYWNMIAGKRYPLGQTATLRVDYPSLLPLNEPVLIQAEDSLVSL